MFEYDASHESSRGQKASINYTKTKVHETA